MTPDRIGLSRQEGRTGHNPLLLLLVLPLLLAASWTEDKGEPGTEADALSLGADVVPQVGPPAGPPVMGLGLEDATAALSARLRCPSCQSHSINDSPSESARNMKRQVRAMLAAGYDDAQILAYFEAAYGEFVLMMPKARGFNTMVWAAPALLLLFGFVAAARTIGRKRGDEAQAGAGWGEDPADPKDGDLAPYLARVRQEIDGDD